MVVPHEDEAGWSAVVASEAEAGHSGVVTVEAEAAAGRPNVVATETKAR